MYECYYYVEKLPGTSLEDSYIRRICEKCHYKNMKLEAWSYSGPLPNKDLHCYICNTLIYQKEETNS